jgi:hypothetical protein
MHQFLHLNLDLDTPMPQFTIPKTKVTGAGDVAVSKTKLLLKTKNLKINGKYKQQRCKNRRISISDIT